MSNLDRTCHAARTAHVGGTLASLPALAQPYDVRSPALIVIGTVVSLHEKFSRQSRWHDAGLTSRKACSRNPFRHA